jgi:hypothetical protein
MNCVSYTVRCSMSFSHLFMDIAWARYTGGECWDLASGHNVSQERCKGKGGARGSNMCVRCVGKQIIGVGNVHRQRRGLGAIEIRSTLATFPSISPFYMLHTLHIGQVVQRSLNPHPYLCL